MKTCKKPRNFTRGGNVRGPGTATSDSILARISNGEYVLPKPAVDMVGRDRLERLRQMALAQAPGYALGGEVNQYGNDLSLANRMKAGAEQMRAMRTGSPIQTETNPNSQFASALSQAFQANNPQQSMDAYRTAMGKADPLDVASGRFAREYQPGFSRGGSVEWERLPMFAEGGLPMTPSQLKEMAESLSKIAKPDDLGRAFLPSAAARPVDSFGNQWTTGANARPVMGNPANMPTPPSPNVNPSAIKTIPAGAGTGLGASLLGAATSPLALGATALAGSLYPSELGSGTLDSPEAQRQMAINQRQSTESASSSQPIQWVADVPAYPGSTDRVRQGIAALKPTTNPAPAAPVNPNPSPASPANGMADASFGNVPALEAAANEARAAAEKAINNPGRNALDVGARGLNLAPIYGGSSRQVGTRMISDVGGEPTSFLPSQTGTATHVVRGSSMTEKPIYETPYYDQQGNLIATITGPDKAKGGGTVSQPDQGNGGTIEGNVAALNRQYEALKSRNEAYGLGDRDNVDQLIRNLPKNRHSQVAALSAALQQAAAKQNDDFRRMEAQQKAQQWLQEQQAKQAEFAYNKLRNSGLDEATMTNLYAQAAARTNPPVKPKPALTTDQVKAEIMSNIIAARKNGDQKSMDAWAQILDRISNPTMPGMTQ